MITEISIAHLGIIEHATFAPGSHLTVLTGETGAGKTMVLSAVGMLLGGKIPAGLLKPEARTRVEGCWRVQTDEVIAAVTEVGGVVEDEELILARTASGAGRSRAFVGGAGVPAATLEDIAGGLVAVHGQSEQLRLRGAVRQRRLLDAFGEFGERDLFERLGLVVGDLAIAGHERVDPAAGRAVDHVRSPLRRP